MHRIPASDRISFMYFERGQLEVSGHSLIWRQTKKELPIPVGITLVIMLGPGSSVTHAAIRLCAEEGCQILWVGEQGVRLYASTEARANPKQILKQFYVYTNDELRLNAARRIYEHMFEESPPNKRSIEQLRGIEGAKVKLLYRNLASSYGLEWNGRNSGYSDPVNKAICIANSTLYGVTESAIIALGYSPSIGVIHNGDPKSFVYDISDTIKFKTVVPLAMEVVAQNPSSLDRRIRHACRDLFSRDQIVQRLVDIIEDVINAPGSY